MIMRVLVSVFVITFKLYLMFLQLTGYEIQNSFVIRKPSVSTTIAVLESVCP